MTRSVNVSLKAPLELASRPSGDNTKQRYRTMFMRDRDRVMYSKSFRRLSGKTQVFLSGNDDHKRTRLTHTLEVAQIAKTIAKSLKLDIDLTEAIALGHDIGHTPFGHAGERMLHIIMTSCSEDDSMLHKNPMQDICDTDVYDQYLGFKHNLQSIEVALEIEKDYDIYGLDLTNFTLYGMKKHSSEFYKKDMIKNHNKLGYYKKYDKYMKVGMYNAWSFEAFVVKEADEIAQRHHDLEDAIRGKLITKEDVISQIKNVFAQYLDVNDKKLLKKMENVVDDEEYISLLSRVVVNLFVTRITDNSIYNMNEFIKKNNLNRKKFIEYMKNNDESDVRSIIAYDKVGEKELFKKQMDVFKEYLSTRVLSSYEIQTADAHGQYIIKKLFQAYYKTPAQLPNHCVIEFFKSIDKKIEQTRGIGELRSEFKNMTDKELKKEEKMALMRVICNQISGMTDTFAQKTYNDLYS